MTTETCIHQPKPTPGVRCNCLECRKARTAVFILIHHQCVLCAGRCDTDQNGNVACEKGDSNCPILDLWWSVINREIDPNKVNAVKVELTYQRKIQPPKVYPRTTATAFDLGAIPGIPASVPAEEEVPEAVDNEQELEQVAVEESRPVLTAEENVPVVQPKKRRGKRA